MLFFFFCQSFPSFALGCQKSYLCCVAAVVIALLQSDFSFATILQFPNRRGLSGNYQHENKGKDRPARTPHVAFVVASHYHLQIIFLHLQAYLDKFIANPTASLNT